MEGHEPHSLDHLPVILGNVLYHYTCNPPSEEILRRKGIKAVGDRLHDYRLVAQGGAVCANPFEVLEIPFLFCYERDINVFAEKPQLILDLENSLRNLGRI